MNENRVAGLIIVVVLCLMISPAAACHAYLNKIGPANACDNNEITYSITVTHDSLNGYLVKVVDTLPSGVTYVSSSPEGTYSSGKVTWIYEPKTTPNKDLKVTVKTGSPTTSLKNSVDSWVTPKTSPNSYTNKITSTTVTIVKDCEVQLTKAGPATACTDCDMSYTIGAAYSGTNNYYVKIEDALPEGFIDVMPSDGGVYDLASNKITWTFGPVNSGWSKQVTFTAKPTMEATITNSVSSWYGNNINTYTASQISNKVTTIITDCTSAPEFPTMAIPLSIAGAFGCIALFVRRP